MPETTPRTSHRQVRTDHPGLTVRIRRVNRRGQEVESYPAVRLAPATVPMTTSAWPPCQCGLCGGTGAFTAGRRSV